MIATLFVAATLAWQSLIRQTTAPLVRPTTPRSRLLPPTMQGLQRQIAPPAPPPVDDGGGGDGDGGLVLRDVSAGSRRATLTLWQWQWQQRADRALEMGDMSLHDELLEEDTSASFLARWRGDEAPSGWLGRIKGRSLGVFVAGSLEGLIGVRYEVDTTSLKNALALKHMIIVDHVVISSAVPDKMYTIFNGAIVQTLVQMGGYHNMGVVFCGRDLDSDIAALGT